MNTTTHSIPALPTRPVAELASLRRRLACMLYETLPAFGVIVVGGLVPHVLMGIGAQITIEGWALWLHLFVLLGLYFVFIWHRHRQTLAMQTWSLQIVDALSGRPATLKQLIVRYICAWPSVLLLLSGIGILWSAFVDRDRQFPHDRIAGTCIVFTPHKRGQ